ncbi:Fur family transcriptional regulator [Sphingomonas sp. Leaf231]|uniref:Fur family transcriptional regulator n=1 Tax=Sphingomonas sp. Leaf231 TaxID=1736301 RepID=UPI0006FBD15D|nr:transcriptional repressor [Sphingomonas sp. Leaf231]KQN90041.1 Fur family transcriptional regulator [Sphingomonas sp. Leaf231]
MAGHRHHEPRGDDLLAVAQATLEQSGEQWTTMRASVYLALAEFAKPASAYDIAESLSRSEGRRIAANSIYRILDLFVAANLALRVESANAYVANAHPGCRHDCIFLVCDGCGNTTHFDDDLLTGGLRAAASAAGFVTERPVVEVRGRCARCAAERQVQDRTRIGQSTH